MGRGNNYLIQVRQAQARFLEYDQQSLIRKLNLQYDEQYLYAVLFYRTYRIDRNTGDFSRKEGEDWVDANTFDEVLTLLDLICDSREDRTLSGEWKSMQDFGHMFHQNLLKDGPNPLAAAIQANPDSFCKACERIGGKPIQAADVAYSFEVFDGLPVGLFFWEGDDEFFPRIRFYWDRNAALYIRYETMYYAVNFLTDMIQKQMQ